jgi:hypothetical protein
MNNLKKQNTWKTVIRLLITVLTAIATTLTTTSCMGCTL